MITAQLLGVGVLAGVAVAVFLEAFGLRWWATRQAWRRLDRELRQRRVPR